MKRNNHPNIVFEIEGNTTTAAPEPIEAETLIPKVPYLDNREVEAIVVTWVSGLIMALVFGVLAITLIRFFYRRSTQQQVEKIHEEFRESRAIYYDTSEGEAVYNPPPLSPPGTDPIIDEQWFARHKV